MALSAVSALCGIARAADPQQPREIEAHRGGRYRIEAIAGIHERHRFAARRGSRQRMAQQRRAAR